MKKTVLITGTSSGLGKTAANYFAAHDWNVVATMRAPEKERALTGPSDVLVTRLDVQDRASIEAAIESGIARFGKIDAVINNAGFGLFGVFEAISREKCQEQFDINVFGVMDVTRAILRFSESLSYELASQTIIVKIVEPGGVLSTNFGKRSGTEAAQNLSIPDYDAFVAGANAIFASLRGRRSATEEGVAQVIFAAATDGTNQLRYVATEDIQPLVKARRETSEEQYIEFMRSRYLGEPYDS